MGFGYFLGKTGDWKNHFNPEMNRRLDEWIHKSLEASDLKFTMELDHQDWKQVTTGIGVDYEAVKYNMQRSNCSNKYLVSGIIQRY